jgi:2'-5' RNA ligase
MRVFIAIELPQELKEKIFTLAEEVTQGMDIKLVGKENLHLTLAFLGEVPEEKIPEMVAVLKNLPARGKIHLTLGSWEPFPQKQRPHGIWINVGGETGKLFGLYKRIIDGLLAKGFVLTKNALQFSPHITVGRLKSGGVRSLEKVSLPASFTAEKISLFESRLTENGPLYGKLAEFEIK